MLISEHVTPFQFMHDLIQHVKNILMSSVKDSLTSWPFLIKVANVLEAWYQVGHSA